MNCEGQNTAGIPKQSRMNRPEGEQDGIQREIKAYDEDGKPKASSYTMQHIREQLNYLELANLIRISNGVVVLNPKEEETIKLFTEDFDKKPDFDIYIYDLGTVISRKEFQRDWDVYYSRLSKYASKFATQPDAINFEPKEQDKKEKSKPKKDGVNLTEFGDEGEAIIYEYEKARVTAFSPRLANKVLSLGKTKGLGYDIQSVIAEPGDEAEFVKYIEVKSTKRLTCPDLNDQLWVDTLNITRNEYVAANQHKDYYSIFRVFFTRDGVSVFVINNVAEKIKDGRIKATPMTYRVDYAADAVNSFIPIRSEEENV